VQSTSDLTDRQAYREVREALQQPYQYMVFVYVYDSATTRRWRATSMRSRRTTRGLPTGERRHAVVRADRSCCRGPDARRRVDGRSPRPGRRRREETSIVTVHTDRVPARRAPRAAAPEPDCRERLAGAETGSPPVSESRSTRRHQHHGRAPEQGVSSSPQKRNCRPRRSTCSTRKSPAQFGRVHRQRTVLGVRLASPARAKLQARSGRFTSDGHTSGCSDVSQGGSSTFRPLHADDQLTRGRFSHHCPSKQQ